MKPGTSTHKVAFSLRHCKGDACMRSRQFNDGLGYRDEVQYEVFDPTSPRKTSVPAQDLDGMFSYLDKGGWSQEA